MNGDAASSYATLCERMTSGMAVAIDSEIAPGLSDGHAFDRATQLSATLRLLAADAAWTDAHNREFARIAGISEAIRTGSPVLERERLRQLAAENGGTAAVAGELWLQRRIADLRDRASSSGEGQTSPATEASAGEIGSRLAEYLRAQTGRSDLAVSSATELPGGRSKRTFIIQTKGAPQLPARCVLRLDRPAALLDTRAAEEFDLLARLHELGGIPVPRPLLAETDSTVLGGSFVLVDLVRGSRAGEFFPDACPLPGGMPAICRQLAAILGRLHSAEAWDVVLGDKHPPDVNFEAKVAALPEEAAGAGLASAELAAASAWLTANLDQAGSPPSLRHGDIGLHNLLVDDGNITGLLDWELAGAGPAAADLAAVRHVVAGYLDWEEFGAIYLASGGPQHALEPRHLAFHTMLLHARISITSARCRMIFETGASNDFVFANAGFDSAVRARRLLVETVAKEMGLS